MSDNSTVNIDRRAMLSMTAAALGFVQSAALDYVEKGIRINTLIPGTTDTALVRVAAHMQAIPDAADDTIRFSVRTDMRVQGRRTPALTGPRCEVTFYRSPVHTEVRQIDPLLQLVSCEHGTGSQPVPLPDSAQRRRTNESELRSRVHGTTRSITSRTGNKRVI